MIREHQLPKIVQRRGKRVGRGFASGRGKTSGRGMKGQRARATVRRGFEGGQTRLVRRLPFIRGKSFRGAGRVVPVVNLNRIEERFKTSEKVTLTSLIRKGLVRKGARVAKILGRGSLSKKYEFGAGLWFSQRAVEKIITAGGKLPQSSVEGKKD